MYNTTGLHPEQFENLVDRLRSEHPELLIEPRNRGGHHAVSFSRRVHIALCYLKLNFCEAALAEFFDTSQPTVSRIITTFTPVDPAWMTAPGSPWTATAVADPAECGAAVVRALALRLAGQLPVPGDVPGPSPSPPSTAGAVDPGAAAVTMVDGVATIAVPGQLLTQGNLRQRGIGSPDDLWAALSSMPGAVPVTVATAAWLPNAMTRPA